MMGDYRIKYLDDSISKENKFKVLQNCKSREQIIATNKNNPQKVFPYDPLKKSIVLNHHKEIRESSGKLFFEKHKNSIQPCKIKIPKIDNNKILFEFNLGILQKKKVGLINDNFKTVEKDDYDEEQNPGKNVNILFQIYNKNVKSKPRKNLWNKNRTFLNTPHNGKSLGRLFKEINKKEDREDDDNITVIENDCENDYSKIYNCLNDYSHF